MQPDATRLREAPPSGATRAKRLKFRAWRRGLKEVDLLLGPFADAHADNWSEAELARFEALLDEADSDIYAWIAGPALPPAHADHDLLSRIRASAHARTESRGERGA
jgi:antitoxin CptB